jgi:hypothetical protein
MRWQRQREREGDDDKHVSKHVFTKGNNATSVPCIARCFGFSFFHVLQQVVLVTTTAIISNFFFFNNNKKKKH